MDKYILGQSKIGTIDKDTCEVILDLQLQDNTYYDHCLIYGYVTDLCERPIEHATVIFLNKYNEQIATVSTSTDGRYTYFGLETHSEVRMMIKKSGYRSYVSHLIKLNSRKVKYNVTLQGLPVPNRILLSGHITDEDDTPLGNIILYLSRACCCSKKGIYKSTISNEYGQFIFSDIPRNNYFLFINDPMFKPYQKTIRLIDADKIFPVDIKLTSHECCTKITGQITDATGKGIPNAFVILYVVEDGSLTPLQYSRCDQAGRYCFMNLPYNHYIVKAQQ